jgi:hypothetical protein
LIGRLTSTWAAAACLLASDIGIASEATVPAVWVEGSVVKLRVEPQPGIATKLHELLRERSHVIVDYGAEGSLRRIDVILLGAGGEATGTRPGREDFESIEQLVGKALSLAPAAERARAAEVVAYGSGVGTVRPDYAGQVLAQQLSDPDESLRLRAIETIKDTADAVPFELLAQVAREDASAQLRAAALALLVERAEDGEADEPLRIALSDEALLVRERARELMLDWYVELD